MERQQGRNHWKDLNHELIKLRLDERKNKISQRFSELKNFIWSVNNSEPGAASNRLLEEHQSLAQELVAEAYNIYCEVAADLGYEKSPAFVSTVYNRALLPLIRDLGECEKNLCHSASLLPGRAGELQTLLEIAATYMTDLERHWQQKLYREAVELKHKRRTDRIVKCEASSKQPKKTRMPRKTSLRMRRAKAQLAALWAENPKASHKEIAELADKRRIQVPWAGCPDWGTARTLKENALKTLLSKAKKQSKLN